MRDNTSLWNNTFPSGYLDILGFFNNGIGDGANNGSTSTVADSGKPTAVANYIIILFFLFPVIVMSILCFLRIRVNMLSRRDKGYWSRREYLYRVHSVASQAPVAMEVSQPLTNGHLSRNASSNSQSSSKSSKSANKEEDIIKPV